jgi:AraC family transcriptional regulator, ethanolamine operon transcriptional activator
LRIHCPGGSRRLQIFRRAREYIQHELSEGISVTDVCRIVGVSRRCLEGVFRAVVGVGPAHYVRALQLNRIRRELLAPHSATLSIGAIAARHGLWHWSRFATFYRELFGELPSQTRRRAFSDNCWR